MLKGLIKPLLFIALGCGIGVFVSQYSYFTLSKEISLTEVLLAIFTGIIAIYIADDLSTKLSRSQSVKALFTEEVKAFVTSIQILENWLEEGNCTAKELKRFLRGGTIKLNTLIKIYGGHKGLNAEPIEAILNSFNALKNEITEIPPSSNGELYKFNPAQQHQFSEQLNNIKIDLVDVMVKA